jgi:hypothetical protein
MANHIVFQGENGDIIQVTRTRTNFPTWLIIVLLILMGICGLSQPGANSCNNPEWRASHHRVCQ